MAVTQEGAGMKIVARLTPCQYSIAGTISALEAGLKENGSIETQGMSASVQQSRKALVSTQHKKEMGTRSELLRCHSVIVNHASSQCF